ncbi:MAG: tyrosine-type recombinase/integrase [Tissierellales bacterium]|nr:tyrosine-type recombinase/integrase [Tissierellales bacterium]
MKKEIKNYNTKSYLDFSKLQQLVKCIIRFEKKKKQRIALFIAIGMYSGLRSSDIFNIEKRDLINNEVVLYEIKTNKRRQVYFSESFYDLIRDIDLDDFHDLLFYNEKTGDCYKYRYMLDQIKAMAQKHLSINPKSVSTHVLRKSYARRYYELSPDKSKALIELSEILNHANTSLTRHYISLNEDDYKTTLDLF